MADIRGCVAMAARLSGLIQAMEALDGDSTPQAFEGRGALLVTIGKMSEELYNALDKIADEIEDKQNA